MGADILHRDTIAGLIANTAAWEDWTAEPDSTARLARVISPELTASDIPLPAITLVSGASTRRPQAPHADNPAFHASGVIRLLCFAAIDSGETMQDSERDFADRFTSVIDDLVSHESLAKWQSRSRISGVDILGWSRTDLMTEQDFDEDSTNFTQRHEQTAFWIGRANINWGVLR